MCLYVPALRARYMEGTPLSNVCERGLGVYAKEAWVRRSREKDFHDPHHG